MFRLLVGLLLISTPAFAQSTPTHPTPTNSQTLQAILSELRQLRQELTATAATTQRVQITLYRLQLQETTVLRLTQRLDDIHSELAQMEEGRKQLAFDIKRQEELVERTENPAADRKAVEAMLPQQKERLEAMQAHQQAAQTKESEMQVQLRLEQAKLDTLQSDLARLEGDLEKSSQRRSH